MKGNHLAVCDHCGYRFFSEKAKQQVKDHLSDCHPYQSELAERARLQASPPPVVEPVPDESDELPVRKRNRRAE